jgi:secreted repeat protein with Y-X4-D motif
MGIVAAPSRPVRLNVSGVGINPCVQLFSPAQQPKRASDMYLWIKDQKPGDRSGDGLNKVWHVVAQ